MHELRYNFYADVSPDSSRIAYTTCRLATEAPSWWQPRRLLIDLPYYRAEYRRKRSYEIATANIDGSETRRLTKNLQLDHYPVWSPDGTRIAFMSNSERWAPENGGRLYKMASDGSDVRLLTPSLDNLGFYPPVWSPDGERIAFIAREEERRGQPPLHSLALHVVEADGYKLTRIGETTGMPTWSPDGSELAFAAGGEHEPGVYAIRPDGTGLRLIIPVAGVSQVRWSPDGTGVLLLGDTVSVVAPDGSGLQQIAGQTYVAATWSPDGSRIALLTYKGSPPHWQRGCYRSPGEIVTMARDGTDLRVLVSWEDGVDCLAPELIVENPDPMDNLDDAGACSAGTVVPDPASNPGLVQDCEALLVFKHAAAHDALPDWSVRTPLMGWEGVAVGGSPLRVRELVLWELGLSGSLPPEIGNLTALERLDLRRNYLKGPIPRGLGSLAKLREVNLQNNRLTGGIPPELSKLEELEVLDLVGNSLSGRIPPELGSLVSVKVLGLSGNSLMGEVPPELGSLANLEILDLRLNEIAGEIPPELGGLANLELLFLGKKLTGAIPPELGRLTNLKWMWFYGNELTGPLPSEFGALPNLQDVSLIYETVSTCAPSGWPDRWVRGNVLKRCQE